MADFDLTASTTLRWTSKDQPRERHFHSVRDAARVAMRELSRAEFFSATMMTGDNVYSGDQIVEIFQTGGLARKGYAGF